MSTACLHPAVGTGHNSGVATCECRTTERHLALIEDAIEAVVREAERLLPEDERLREEERLLLDLQARIEERLAVLAA